MHLLLRDAPRSGTGVREPGSFMEHLVQQHREIRSGFEALLERTGV